MHCVQTKITKHKLTIRIPTNLKIKLGQERKTHSPWNPITLSSSPNLRSCETPNLRLRQPTWRTKFSLCRFRMWMPRRVTWIKAQLMQTIGRGRRASFCWRWCLWTWRCTLSWYHHSFGLFDGCAFEFVFGWISKCCYPFFGSHCGLRCGFRLSQMQVTDRIAISWCSQVKEKKSRE